MGQGGGHSLDREGKVSQSQLCSVGKVVRESFQEEEATQWRPLEEWELARDDLEVALEVSVLRSSRLHGKAGHKSFVSCFPHLRMQSPGISLPG